MKSDSNNYHIPDRFFIASNILPNKIIKYKLLPHIKIYRTSTILVHTEIEYLDKSIFRADKIIAVHIWVPDYMNAIYLPKFNKEKPLYIEIDHNQPKIGV